MRVIIYNTKMHFIIAWTLLFLSVIVVQGVPYGSVNDLYDTNYEYDFGDNQVRDEVLITKTPKILSDPLELVVNEGQTVRLPCLVDRLEGFVLLWRKNDRIISVGPQIVDKSTSTIQLEEEENGNTLVISLTDHTDEAEYVCSVSAYRKTEIRHNVRIRVEPVITTSPKEPLTLPEGGSATLSCQLLSGTPIPDLKWKRCDGGNFPNGGKEIVKDIVKFESVTRDHSGCYLCQAQNGFAEEPVTSMATLVVEYPPSVHIKKSEDSSETLTITCTVESHPSPQISWLKNGEIIEDEKKHIVINTHSARSTLNLVSLDETDFGNYTCEAENKFGKDWKSVRLTGKEHHMEFLESVERTSRPLTKPNGNHAESEVKYQEVKSSMVTEPYRGSFSKLKNLDKSASIEFKTTQKDQENDLNIIQGQILSHPRLQWSFIADSYEQTKSDESTMGPSSEVNTAVESQTVNTKTEMDRTSFLETERNAVEYSTDSKNKHETQTQSSNKPRPGHIYFARKPSLYTLPEQKTKRRYIRPLSLIKKKPNNVNDFLQLLRIYHNSPTALNGKLGSYVDNHDIVHETTDSNLLRSTHAYLDHLTAMTNTESRKEIEKMNTSGIEQLKESSDNDKTESDDKTKLFKEYDKSGRGYQIDFSENNGYQTQSAHDIKIQLQQKTNEQHSLQKELGDLADPKIDILPKYTKQNEAKEVTINDERVEEQQHHKLTEYETPENHQKTVISGARYLVKHVEGFDNLSEDVRLEDIKMLRGRHSFQTSLGGFNHLLKEGEKVKKESLDLSEIDLNESELAKESIGKDEFNTYYKKTTIEEGSGMGYTIQDIEDGKESKIGRKSKERQQLNAYYKEGVIEEEKSGMGYKILDIEGELILDPFQNKHEYLETEDQHLLQKELGDIADPKIEILPKYTKQNEAKEVTINKERVEEQQHHKLTEDETPENHESTVISGAKYLVKDMEDSDNLSDDFRLEDVKILRGRHSFQTSLGGFNHLLKEGENVKKERLELSKIDLKESELSKESIEKDDFNTYHKKATIEEGSGMGYTIQVIKNEKESKIGTESKEKQQLNAYYKEAIIEEEKSGMGYKIVDIEGELVLEPFQNKHEYLETESSVHGNIQINDEIPERGLTYGARYLVKGEEDVEDMSKDVSLEDITLLKGRHSFLSSLGEFNEKGSLLTEVKKEIKDRSENKEIESKISKENVERDKLNTYHNKVIIEEGKSGVGYKINDIEGKSVQDLFQQKHDHFDSDISVNANIQSNADISEQVLKSGYSNKKQAYLTNGKPHLNYYLEESWFPKNFQNGARYLDEGDIKETTIDPFAEKEGTNILRGKYNFDTNLKGNVQLQQVTEIKDNLKKSAEVDELMNDEKGLKEDRKENIPMAKEKMYPKEIQEIEKMYFTKQLPDISRTVPIHPVKLIIPSLKDEDVKDLPFVSNEEKKVTTDHPLDIILNIKPQHEVQMSGERTYAKNLMADTNNNAEHKKMDYVENKVWMSHPMRGDHSYKKTLEDLSKIDEKIALYQKQILKRKESKSQSGPHPFRGLMIRRP